MGNVIQGLEIRLGKKRTIILIYSLLFLVFFVLTFFPFIQHGKSLVEKTDAFNQGATFLIYNNRLIKSLFSSLLSGKLSYKTWDITIGLGMDPVNVISFRPSTWLFALFPESWVEYYIDARLIISLFLAGLFFLFFAFEREKVTFSALAGALIYVFSGFSVYYVVLQATMQPLIMYIPLMFLSIERILKNKSSVVFVYVVMSSAVAGFTNLYMLSVFGVVYGLFRIYHYRLSCLSFKKISAFIILYGVSIGNVAVSLLPTFFNGINSSRKTIGSTSEVIFNSDFVKKMLYGMWQFMEIGNKGFVCVSIISLITIVAVIADGIKKNWHLMIALLGIFLSICIPEVTKLLNGYSAVNRRWMVIIVFLLSWITVKYLDSFLQIERENCIKYLGFCLIAIIGEAYLCVYNNQKADFVVLLLIDSIIFVIFVSLIPSEVLLHRRWGQILLLVFLGLEIVNMSQQIYGNTETNYIEKFCDSSDVYDELISGSISCFQPVIDQSNNYRIDVGVNNLSVKDSEKNMAMRDNYAGIGSYFSYTPSSVIQFADSVGLSQKQPFFAIYDWDNRVGMNTLLGVKYYSVYEKYLYTVPYGYKLVEKKYDDKTQQNVYLYENMYALPLMYTYDSELDGQEYDQLSAYEKENSFLRSCTVNEKNAVKDIFGSRDLKSFHYNDTVIDCNYNLNEVTNDNVQVLSDGLLVKKDGTTIQIRYSAEENSELYVMFENLEYCSIGLEEYANELIANGISEEQIQQYAQNSRRNATQNYFAGIRVGRNNTFKYTYLRGKGDQYYVGDKDIILNMGYSDEAEEGVLEIRFSKMGYYKTSGIRVISNQMNDFPEVINQRIQNPINDIEITNNGIKGKLTTDTNQMVCVSVPYQKGWHAYINGEETALYNINEMFMGVYVEPGQYDIELVYKSDILTVSFFISLFSSICTLMVVICKKSFVLFRKRKTQ